MANVATGKWFSSLASGCCSWHGQRQADKLIANRTRKVGQRTLESLLLPRWSSSVAVLLSFIRYKYWCTLKRCRILALHCLTLHLVGVVSIVFWELVVVRCYYLRSIPGPWYCLTLYTRTDVYGLRLRSNRNYGERVIIKNYFCNLWIHNIFHFR